jgi:endonuclease YncB( thermonuclease family)
MNRRALMVMAAAGAVTATLLMLAFCMPGPRKMGPPAQGWERLEQCRLLPNPWNDGDSFHVDHAGHEYIFRLYFVDTPEAETSLPQRLAEQASYFGISPAEALALGKKASAFTVARLGARPFTVITRWRAAPGRSALKRYYAVVQVGGEDLAELLVAEGLARIYGVRSPLPDGSDSRSFLDGLARKEDAARRNRRGGWAGAGTRARGSPSASTEGVPLRR